MPPKRKAKNFCKHCKHFLDAAGNRCPDTTGLDQAAEQKCFEPGPVYCPIYHNNPVQQVDFDPSEPAAWSFWTSTTQCLMITWEIDHNEYGHFNCYLIEVDDNGVVKKRFTSNRHLPTFAGEIVIKGAGNNDLWASFGCEDDDITDAEGTVMNKPRAVQLRPRRKD